MPFNHIDLSYNCRPPGLGKIGKTGVFLTRRRLVKICPFIVDVPRWWKRPTTGTVATHDNSGIREPHIFLYSTRCTKGAGSIGNVDLESFLVMVFFIS